MSHGLRAAALALGLLLPGLARAWTFSSAEPWPDGLVPVALGLTPALPAAPGAAVWEEALRTAAAAWNGSLERIQLEVQPTTGDAWYENGRNEVFFDREVFDEPFPTGVLAVTAYTHDRGTRVESDIVLNAGWNWSVYSGIAFSNPVDFRRVLLHELGHLLGLNHPDEAGQAVPAIMNSAVGNTEALTSDDQAGARALYRFGPGVAPVIVTAPADATVKQGAAATLSVTAGGRRPFRYEWRRNGTPIPGATAATLTLPAARLDEAGDYAVTIANDGGAVTSGPVRVTVAPAAPPSGQLVYGSQPQLKAGESFVLHASISGDPPLRYEWKRDGVPLPGAGQRNLAIDDVQFSDAGDYTLTVSNVAGSHTTAPRRLVVDPPAPLRFTHALPSVSVGLGEVLTLNAPVALTQDYTFQWQKDGVDLPGATLWFYVRGSFRPEDAGRYTVVIGNAFGRLASAAGVVTLHDGSGSTLIRRQPASVTIERDRFFSLSVEARGGSAQYRWYKDGVPLASATGNNLNLYSGAVTVEGAYHVVVADGARTEVSQTARVRVLGTPRPPEILLQPASETVPRGGDAVFAVSADGAPLPERYQWYKDDVALPGATDAKLRLRGVEPGAAGAYTVVVASAEGSVASQPAFLAVDLRSRLVNLAARAPVGRGDDVLIAGFTIGGREPRAVLVRGIGDQLAEFGVSGVLRDPVLRIFDAVGRQLASNDDWFRTNEATTAELAAAARLAGAFPQRPDARDAALVQTLAPGGYTAQVSGLVSTTGVGLVEIYELGKPGQGRLINLSSRVVVGTGANILIPGLVLQGTAPRRLLIRAVGPGLAALGVPRTLADPQLKVLRSDGATVGENNNWGEQAGAATPQQIAATTLSVGGFPLAAGSKDAAVLLDLPADNYTIQVSGVNDTEGIALVEVCEVP